MVEDWPDEVRDSRRTAALKVALEKISSLPSYRSQTTIETYAKYSEAIKTARRALDEFMELSQ